MFLVWLFLIRFYDSSRSHKLNFFVFYSIQVYSPNIPNTGKNILSTFFWSSSGSWGTVWVVWRLKRYGIVKRRRWWYSRWAEITHLIRIIPGIIRGFYFGICGNQTSWLQQWFFCFGGAAQLARTRFEWQLGERLGYYWCGWNIVLYTLKCFRFFFNFKFIRKLYVI